MLQQLLTNVVEELSMPFVASLNKQKHTAIIVAVIHILPIATPATGPPERPTSSTDKGRGEERS